MRIKMYLKLWICFVYVFAGHFLSQAAVANQEQIISANTYVGSSQCVDCHQQQYKDWQGSHHDMAMRHADTGSVTGDFGDITFISNGKPNRFYQKGTQYWVNIEGPDSQFHDYQIKYTFGFEPLQQYMVEFDDGRVQLIPFAWDARSKAEGGQRWFNLYPEQTNKHQEFYWTNTGQNWNYMCADCHSTNVKKNFDIKTNSYNTTFSEMSVGCEACHGAGSEHIAWTKNKTNLPHFGFERDMSKPVTKWLTKTNSKTLQPETITPTQQTLVCAQCHSRRVQISNNDHVSSSAFGERHLLSLINNQHYYPDGQVYDEDYVYGSFLQSKMSKKGVVCSNCHEPHSAKLTLPKEQVCLQCHQADAYDKSEHHQHKMGSEGAQCVNCHMPETTYMKIDKRRDHRWHIPKPEQSKQLGVPDSCVSCHADKNSQWSETLINTWYPHSRKNTKGEFAPVFAATDQGYDTTEQLSHIAQNSKHANIIRASALERMQTMSNKNTIIAIVRGVKHEDENIRIGAISGAEGIRDEDRWRIIAPLLNDKVLAVRSEAARVLVPLWANLNAIQRKSLSPALDEYLTIQDFNADRGFAHTNRANVMMHQGKLNDAEKAYKNSIRIDPYFENAYVNLADLYRLQQNNDMSIKLLEEAITLIPDQATLPFSLGLAYIRDKQKNRAVEYLREATLIEPENAHYHYVYGVGIEELDLTSAQVALRKAYNIGQNAQHLYALCDMQIRHKVFGAKKCVNELKGRIPRQHIEALQQKLNGS